jgi:hypothetical protein
VHPSRDGPRNPNSYSFAPAFWIAQADLLGPVLTYVPKRDQSTRNNTALAIRYWVMVFTCLLSEAINLQVVGGRSPPLLAQGLPRMSCEVKTTMDFQLRPVSGHNFHGQVEARIKTALKLIDSATNTTLPALLASDPSTPHITDQAARSLVRLFNVDELHWQEDTNLPLAPNYIEVNQTPPPDRLSCGCYCHPHHALKSTDTIPPDSPLAPNPAPDDTPHILTLGALSLSVGQQPF